MAKQRLVNTKFWTDTYSSKLDPIEKLMFLYFLTNPHTNISGIYELPLRNIAFDTGIDKDMVEKILERFAKDQKIHYIDGWVYIVNFVKNQNQGSSKVQTGINNELSKVPTQIVHKIKEINGTDTLSHLNPNSNLNLTEFNSNLNSFKNNFGKKPNQ